MHCLSVCPAASSLQAPGGEVGAGREVALTSSNVWLSLLETPSWGWPPLPFLSLSLKHVPSKSPSLQTPPVEPSPDLLPRRPTFLRLATLKGPAQARTQTPPPHVLLLCTFRRPETHKDTVGHSSHLCTQEVAHGAHLTPGSQTSTNIAMCSPLHSAYHRPRSTPFPARGAHRHT